jgi:hypothetical protein
MRNEMLKGLRFLILIPIALLLQGCLEADGVLKGYSLLPAAPADRKN